MSINTLRPLQRFFRLLSLDKGDIINIYIYALFNGLVALSLPLGIQAIINLISGGEVSTSWYVLIFLVIAGITISGIVQLLQLSITERIQQKVFTRSAFEFAYRLPNLKLEQLDKVYVPELVNRFFDTLTVQKALPKILIDFSSASLQIAFGLLLLSFYHPFFIIFGLLFIVTIYLIFRFVGPVGLSTSLKESKYKYKVVYWLEEVGRTMGTFKLAGETNLPLEKTDGLVTSYLKARKSHFRALLLQYSSLLVFKVLIAAGLLIIGGMLVINQRMNIGQFVAAEIIIILVLNSIDKLFASLETIYDVLTALEKIGTVVDLPLDSTKKQQTIFQEAFRNAGMEVNIKKLSYQFPTDSAPILKNINLYIPAEEHLCISGFNGSGKSVLLRLIGGLYQDYEGTILYNGVPQKNMSLSYLHSNIGDSFEREDIFRATLLENLVVGRKNISFEEIQEAIKVTSLAQFIEGLPLGFETPLYPSGQGLASSIVRKIKLARCILGKPKLILLEDNINQLNRKDRKVFIDYLLSPHHNWTVIMVSNDINIVKRFPQITVLDKGAIVGRGTFDEVAQIKCFSDIHDKNLM